MAGELLLINPSKRRAAKRKSNPRKRRAARKPNPIALRAPKRRAGARRSRNPISARRATAGMGGMIKAALIGGVGAIAVDKLYAYVSPNLPQSLNTGYGGVAVKAVATILLGNVLSGATKGMSRAAAAGALTVQMRDLVNSFMPTATPTPTAGFRMGYASPNPVTSARGLRFDPMRTGAFTRSGVGAFTPSGVNNVSMTRPTGRSR